jgi:hypothetical protein
MKRIARNLDPSDSIENVVDCLLAKVLEHAPCAIEAQLEEGNPMVTWREKTKGDEVFWELSARHFRSILARIGNHYLDGQLYEGFGVVEVGFEDESNCQPVRIFFGNHSLTGCWIRIYAGNLADAFPS